MGSKPPAPFLKKTHQMVEDGETDDVISWGEKGISFVVWKPVEFARDLLPAHFKHNNFSSFVRQLNTYGFRKVVSDRWEFANDDFRRGEQRLLCDIRRKKVSSPAAPPAAVPSTSHLLPSSASRSADVLHSSSSTSSPPQPPRPPQSQHLLNLSRENEKLRRDNQSLSTELEHAKRHCEELLGFLSNYVDVRLLDLDLITLGIGNEEGEETAAEEEDEDEDEGEKVDCLKLFGVLLKESRGTLARSRKRRRCDGGGALSEVGGSWMSVSSTVVGSSNVRE